MMQFFGHSNDPVLERLVARWRERVASSGEVHVIGPLLARSEAVSIRDSLHERQTPVLYLDGAVLWRDFLRAECSVGIGDGDSGAPSGKLDIVLPREKNASDLEIALGLLQKLPLRRIHASGLIGGRKDHELLVLGGLCEWARNQLHLEGISFANGAVEILARGHHRFFYIGLLSLVATRSTELELQGALKYPLKKMALSAYTSRTLSNEAWGEFEIITDEPLLLFRPGA